MVKGLSGIQLIMAVGLNGVQFSLITQVINKIVCSHNLQESNLLITCMIMNRIGWHEVLLPINQNYDKI